MNAIQTVHLTKQYGNNREINDINLTVEEGDFFGFIGPNGAGKSTTIRTLLGLLTPTSGQGLLLGKDVRCAKCEVLQSIGYLPSETNFYQGMKVKDVLRLSADLHKKNCAKEANVLCERLDISPDRKIDELSLGNRKKVAIVCTMQHKPKLYIMDEPTSGLDPLMQNEFYKLLLERNQQGATVFLSCHVLSEVQRYCHNAAVIREGQLIKTGSVAMLSSAEAKRVVLSGITDVPNLADLRDVTVTDDTVSFLYSGSSSDLLACLSSLPLTDFTVSKPDLEEVFMHYYQKEDK